RVLGVSDDRLVAGRRMVLEPDERVEELLGAGVAESRSAVRAIVERSEASPLAPRGRIGEPQEAEALLRRVLELIDRAVRVVAGTVMHHGVGDLWLAEGQAIEVARAERERSDEIGRRILGKRIAIGRGADPGRRVAGDVARAATVGNHATREASFSVRERADDLGVLREDPLDRALAKRAATRIDDHAPDGDRLGDRRGRSNAA